MSIVARCECGNRTSVADVMAGRTIPCPRCGGNMTVPNAPVGGSAVPRQSADTNPSIAISPAIIISAVVGATLFIVLMIFYFGPWRVSKQWSAMSSGANTQVTDVVQFALSAYESQHGLYDASQSHNAPTVENQAGFVPPVMALSLPRYISFLGKSNRGNYRGTYDTTNGEISVDIEYGGFTVGGMVDVRKAIGTFHATGRVADGKVTAEADGEPLKILMRKPNNPRD